MWRPQEAALRAAGFDVLAPDLRGFGQRPMGTEPFSNARDAEALLDGPSVVIGASLGGRVALELAVLRPDLVERLVLIAPGIPGWAWSDETRAGWAAEEEAFERGDFEGAAEASLRQWIDGPRRSSDDVDPVLRASVREMMLRSYELQSAEEAEEEEALEPAINVRLRDVRCPTLVIVGDEDIADMQGIAAHVAASIGGARLETVAEASHLPAWSGPTRSARSSSRSWPRASLFSGAERAELSAWQASSSFTRACRSTASSPGRPCHSRIRWARAESACTSGCSSSPRRQTSMWRRRCSPRSVRSCSAGGRSRWAGRQWEDTPYPVPCFVLTHHAQPPIAEQGGTFTFVADGAVSAVTQARAAADGKSVIVMGADDVARAARGGARGRDPDQPRSRPAR